MSIDSIGNFLTIIRNGIMASKPYVIARSSKMNSEIGGILLNEGFIDGVDQVVSDQGHQQLKITLRYVEGESVIHSLKRVSKPSRRIYAGIKKIKPVIGGLGISILSTNRGVMSDKQAKSKDLFVGGEVMCTVW